MNGPRPVGQLLNVVHMQGYQSALQMLPRRHGTLALTLQAYVLWLDYRKRELDFNS